MSRPFTSTTTHRSTVSTAITALAAGLILSVMFLMAMRWVLEYEDTPDDRKNMAMIADWIIINTMLKDS